MTTPLLETRQLTKRFGPLLANDRIDLAVYGGEVHAILGENGAGKSTLMKSLYGFHQPTSGEILLDGAPVTIDSPLRGRRLGVGMVFQSFTLIPAMTVLENITLFLPDAGVVIRGPSVASQVQAVADRYNLQVDLNAYVGELALGEQQKVEILKILIAGARILIFDEPTSVLAPHEVEGLFNVFAKLTADGFAVLFITHKLPEVMASAHRITVLRKGAVAGTMVRDAATERGIIALMLGGEAAPSPELGYDTHSAGPKPASPADTRPLRAQLTGVSLPGDGTATGLTDVDMTVYAGEIVGIAGVSGNGQGYLGDLLLALRRPVRGAVQILGRDLATWSTPALLDAGVACIPEDPLRMGAVSGMTVLENMVLGEQESYARRGGLTLDWTKAQDDAERRLNTTFVSTAPKLSVPVETLSGGNLQRVVIARELGRNPELLVAYYPVRGLDVSNAAATHRLLRRYRDAGAGIVLISEDLDELFSMSDRLFVMYHGSVVGEFTPDTMDRHVVGHLMTGGKGEVQ